MEFDCLIVDTSGTVDIDGIVCDVEFTLNLTLECLLSIDCASISSICFFNIDFLALILLKELVISRVCRQNSQNSFISAASVIKYSYITCTAPPTA